MIRNLLICWTCSSSSQLSKEEAGSMVDKVADYKAFLLEEKHDYEAQVITRCHSDDVRVQSKYD